MTNTDLDARAARAMGWTYPVVGDSGKEIQWSPSRYEAHFEYLALTIANAGLWDTFMQIVTSRPGFAHGKVMQCTPLPTRVLAACEALEAAQ